jgi:hypothetical protein
MFGASKSARHAPYLRHHKEAKLYHDSIKPIRGRATEYRPVGSRRSEASIREDANGDIVVKLYHTDILRFTACGTKAIVNLGGYNTRTTHAWLNGICGFLVFEQYGVWCPYRKPDGSTKRGITKIHTNGGNIFSIPLDQTSWVFENPVFPVVSRADRKALNETRRLYAPFLDYVRGLQKLSEDGKIKLDWKYAFHEAEPTARKSDTELLEIAKQDDAELHYSLLCLLYSRGYRRCTDPLKYFNRLMIRHHRDEVLTRETVYDGVRITDNYAWAWE